MADFYRQAVFPHPAVRLFVNAMHLFIIFAVLEVVAIVLVASLCIMARRSDERTERTLTRDEIEVRRQVAEKGRRAQLDPFSKGTMGRWLAGVLRSGNRDKRGS
jgi:uncharacterized membrane protein